LGGDGTGDVSGLGTPNFSKLAVLAMDSHLFNFPPAGLALND
jgi:hypothetical protein